MERRTARNWYWWLWLSPLVTLPSSIAMLLILDIGNYYGDLGLDDEMILPVAALGAASCHLVLLFPALNRKSEFVRWHGRQALLLAGVRTAVPLVFGLAFGEEYEVLLFIPVLIVIWFFGTLWAHQQAARGDCSLMRWFGRAEALPAPEPAEEPAQVAEPELEPTPAGEPDPEGLIDIIRYSRDPEERRKVLAELEKLGMVESQYEEEEGGRDEMP